MPQEDSTVVDAQEQDVVGITEGNMSAIAKYFDRPWSNGGPYLDPPPVAPGLLTSDRSGRVYHQQSAAKLDEERTVLQACLDSEDQVDAVLTNDFDRMTYTTFHENYHLYTGKSQQTKAKCWQVMRTDRKGNPKVNFLTRRDILHSQKICFIRTVLPTSDLFYLRLLLQHVPARSFDDLKFGPCEYFNGAYFGGNVHASFQECAREWNLVVDDNEAELAMLEAIDRHGAVPSDLRRLFSLLILL
jgi:hypothetical protein